MGGGVTVQPGESGGWRAFLDPANRRAIIFCALITTGPVLYGYDGTYFTSLLAETAFKRDYGYQITNSDGSIGYEYSAANQSLWTSIIQVGEVVGALAAGFLGDWGGRKGAILAAITLVTIGITIQIAYASSATLTVGRLVIGLGVGVISNAVPLYLSEIPPAAVRASLVSSWQLMLAIGQVIGACVGYGSESLLTSAAYRIPMGINYLWVLLIAIALLVVPESPRWLLYKGKEDKCRRALNKIHGGTDMRETLVQEQLAILHKSKEDEHEKSDGAKSSWSDLIMDKVERRKFIACVGILISQQISGVQFIFSYTTTFFELVGIDDAFTITIVVDCIEVAGVLCAYVIVDRIGRRPLLLWGGFSMMIFLLVVGALGAVAGWKDFSDYFAAHQAQASCVAAFICLYVFAFNLTWGVLAWVVASELSTGRNRQKIMAVGTACFWVTAWATTFTLPYLFNQSEAGLGPMIGFIYGFGAMLTLVFVYFYIPETQGRTLEEINFYWQAGIPVRQWISYDPATVVARDDKKAARQGVSHHVENAADIADPVANGEARMKRFDSL
ncbi:hypothetical protein Q5752_001058 [Cryptotrichosporon argae]